MCVVICFKLNWAWNHCHQSWNLGSKSNASFDINIFVTQQHYTLFKPTRDTRRLQDYSHGTTFLGPNQIDKCKHLIITFTLNRVNLCLILDLVLWYYNFSMLWEYLVLNRNILNNQLNYIVIQSLFTSKI